MSQRRHLSLGAVLLLVFLAGCTGFGDATSEEGLFKEAEYDWDTEADVTIDLGSSEYTAVYDIENRSSMAIYQRTRYGSDRPLGIEGVKFRHENGTVVNASDIGVSESRNRVTVDFPADQGQFAFTGSKRSKQFTLTTFVEGSYEVALPEDHRVDNFVLATVRPRGYETTMEDDRVHIHWDSVTSRSVTVNYYLQRDLYLFAGLIVIASIAGAVGIGYVWHQIKELRVKREEMGLDLDIDDDEGRKPPPGMR